MNITLTDKRRDNTVFSSKADMINNVKEADDYYLGGWWLGQLYWMKKWKFCQYFIQCDPGNLVMWLQ